MLADAEDRLGRSARAPEQQEVPPFVLTLYISRSDRPSDADPIVVKSLAFDDSQLALCGEILVENRGFEKTVCVVLTTDSWATQSQFYCEFDYALSQQVDQFTVKITGTPRPW